MFCAALEDVEGAVFILAGVPFRGGVSEGGVFEDFDGDVAEGAVSKSADVVGERGGGEAGVSVCEFYGDWRLVFDIVGDFGGAEGYGDVVVTVPVGQGFGVGRNFDIEDADGFVFEGEVMVGLGGDFNFDFKFSFTGEEPMESHCDVPKRSRFAPDGLTKFARMGSV